jgi:hypothetical protein
MVEYPIRVPRDGYRGSQPRRKAKQREANQIAEKLEKYLNDKIAADPSDRQTYIYGFIAGDLGLPTEVVRDILFGVDGGHNGLTVIKNKSAV